MGPRPPSTHSSAPRFDPTTRGRRRQVAAMTHSTYPNYYQTTSSSQGRNSTRRPARRPRPSPAEPCQLLDTAPGGAGCLNLRSRTWQNGQAASGLRGWTFHQYICPFGVDSARRPGFFSGEGWPSGRGSLPLVVLGAADARGRASHRRLKRVRREVSALRRPPRSRSDSRPRWAPRPGRRRALRPPPRRRQASPPPPGPR